MTIYLFYRGDRFYPIELRDDNDAIKNAEHNPGTTKVTTQDGKVVWEKKS